MSRTTARTAIAALRAEGLITVLHGKGAFVRRPMERPAHTHTRTVEATGGTDADTDLDAASWRLVEEPARYRTNATAELALAIGVPEHAPLFVHDRLLASPAQRRMQHRLYLPFQVCASVPELERDPFRTPGELYGILAAAGFDPTWTETVTARIPSPDDTTSLRIPAGTPMLLTRRVTRYSASGQPLAMEETRLSADDTQLAYPITPTATG